MDKKRLVLALMTAVIVTLPLAIFLGCEIDSAESVITDVDLIVEGYYTNPDGGNLVQKNTGSAITSLNVLQDGSSLEAIDNNGLIFRGSIGQVTEGSTASFTLEGYTSTRAAATIVGNFSVSGDSSTMRGTWAEPTLYSTVYGTATVPTNAPPETNVVTTVTIDPDGTITIATNETQSFVADGGDGDYTWSQGNSSIGSLSVLSSDNSVASYTATGKGTNTITVTSDGESASTTVIQQ